MRIGAVLLRIATGAVLLFMYFPLALVIAYAFNSSGTSAWPPAGFTLQWVQDALENTGLRQAFITSLTAALAATAIAVVLGTLASIAVARYRFFGREAVSLLLLLPIALPGIVTGIALSSAIQTTLRPLGIDFGLFTVIVGHSTFCIVVVYNNVLARLRRVGGSLEEASMDLGADVFQTFRFVTFPAVRSALLAGAVLAFALSFDEIIVTTFTAGPGVQTLPIWIYQNLARPNQAPIVNVVAASLIVLSVIPVWLTQRLSADTSGGRL